MATPVIQFKSHIDGKNADVFIWPDRIEWSRSGGAMRTAGRLTAAGMTGGLSLLKSGIRGPSDSNVIPIRMIQGVATHKGGIGYTNVEVTTGGDKVAFRVTKAEAEQIRTTILDLMNSAHQPSAAAQSAPPATPIAPAQNSPTSSVADELAKLAALRDQGVLSEEEFAAQKARLLG